MRVLIASLIYLSGFVLASLPFGQRLIRSNPQWAVVLGVAYVFTVAPLTKAVINGTVSHLFRASSTAWTVFPIMLVIGLAAGWGLWALMQAFKPPAPRY